MKLAMSNIAWAYEDRLTAYALMRKYGFTGLEIAPGLMFPTQPDSTNPSDAALNTAIDEAASFGLHFVSMQSLHFGVEGASLFGDSAARDRFFGAIRNCLNLAERLELRHLVIGSPKARIIPENISQADAEQRAADWFCTFAHAEVGAGQILGVEPNPAAYGTNFLTDMKTAMDFVTACDHPKIGLNFDIGALKMNDQFSDIDTFATRGAAQISHAHVSEPFLKPVDATSGLAQSVGALARARFGGFTSIEMRRPETDPLGHVEAALSALAAAATENAR